jgi:two-component system response regulator EvgA
MRIVVSVDMAMIRHAITGWCREQGHCILAATASAAQTLRLCRRHRPAALLLDVRLPDGDGWSVAEVVRRASPATKVIVLTARPSPYFLHRVGLAPVAGYVDTHAQTCREIGEALAAVARGERWFPPDFHAVRRQQGSHPAFFGKLLTHREQTILGLIGDALSNEEIAARIGIAARTVEDHRGNLLRKLGLDGTPRLVAFALAHGFTSTAIGFAVKSRTLLHATLVSLGAGWLADAAAELALCECGCLAA